MFFEENVVLYKYTKYILYVTRCYNLTRTKYDFIMHARMLLHLLMCGWYEYTKISSSFFFLCFIFSIINPHLKGNVCYKEPTTKVKDNRKKEKLYTNHLCCVVCNIFNIEIQHYIRHSGCAY